MKKIKLTQDKFALVDNKNFDYLNQFKWCAMKHRNTWYVVRAIKTEKGQKLQLMHRKILGLKRGDKQITDHINHNGLNNQEYNLRICTVAQNLQNRFVKQGKSKYKGVSWHQKAQKWLVQICFNYSHFYLGLFCSEIKAAKAYDKVAKKLFGKFANCNFN